MPLIFDRNMRYVFPRLSPSSLNKSIHGLRICRYGHEGVDGLAASHFRRLLGIPTIHVESPRGPAIEVSTSDDHPFVSSDSTFI